MDLELINRSKQGDSGAFDALIEQHREAIFRYAFLILRDAHAAEDVAQETVYRIYHNLHRFDEAYSFRPWALRITRNLARNYYRSWKRLRQNITRFLTHQTTTPSHHNLEAVVDAHQRAQLLHDAVNRLKPDHRDILYLRFFIGIHIDETAAALKISEGTVKSRTHRALQALKIMLEANYPHVLEDIGDDE